MAIAAARRPAASGRSRARCSRAETDARRAADRSAARHRQADQRELLLPCGRRRPTPSARRLARAARAPITASSASTGRHSARADARAVRWAMCDVVEEFKPEVVSFHFGLPEARCSQRVQGCRLPGASARRPPPRRRAGSEDARLRCGHRAGQRGRRPSRHVPDRRHLAAGRDAWRWCRRSSMR